VQSVQAIDRSDEVALHDMPERHTKFARHGDGRFVSPAPRGHRQSPLLQRVSYFKQLLARLDEQGTKRSSAMALEGSASFKIAALRYTRVKAKIGDQLFVHARVANEQFRNYLQRLGSLAASEKLQQLFLEYYKYLNQMQYI